MTTSFKELKKELFGYVVFILIWIIYAKLANVLRCNATKHFLSVKSCDNVAKPPWRHLMKMELPLPAKLSKCEYADISKVEIAYSCLPSVES